MYSTIGSRNINPLISVAVDTDAVTLLAEAQVYETNFSSCSNPVYQCTGRMKSQTGTFCNDTVYSCRIAQQKPAILHVAHDLFCMTSELLITGPTNHKHDNALHIAVDLSEAMGIARFKALLEHDDVDTLITKLDLEGNSPFKLHKAAKLRNPAVFKLLFEEACRSYGYTTRVS